MDRNCGHDGNNDLLPFFTPAQSGVEQQASFRDKALTHSLEPTIISMCRHKRRRGCNIKDKHFVHHCQSNTHLTEMSQLSVQLTAPNGQTWSQPTGLFINNEFVESQKGNKLVTTDPAYALNAPLKKLYEDRLSD